MSYGSLQRAVLPVASLVACAFLLWGSLSLEGASGDEATIFTNGYQAYLKGDTEKAIETLQDVLKQYPAGRVNDLALYWLGKSYQKAGRTQDALSTFRELKTRFPQSAMVGHASRQIVALEKHTPSDQATSPETKAAMKPPKELPPQTKPEAPPVVAVRPAPKPEPLPMPEPAPRQEVAPKQDTVKKPEPAPPAQDRKAQAPPPKAGRVPPPSKTPAQMPLSAPPAGQSVFLVVGQVAGLEVTGVGSRHATPSGEFLTIPFDVMNRGNAEDVFLLAATLPPSYQAAFFHDSDGAGRITAVEQTVTETPRLAVGAHVRFILRARLPIDMNDGATQPFEIKVVSKADPSVSHTAPTTLVASAPVLRGTFAADHAKVKPGDAVSYMLSLSNAGSADARSSRVIVSYPGTLRFLQATPSASSLDPQAHTITWDLARLAPNDRPVVRLDFRVSDDALADQDLGVRAVLQPAMGGQTVSVVSASARVEAVAGVRMAGADAFRTVLPSETVLLSFTLRNTGNSPDRFALTSQDDIGGQVIVVEDRNRDGVRQRDEPVVETTRLLSPQEEIILLTELAVPSDAPDATRHAIRLAASSERSRSAVSETVRLVVIARPMVAVATHMASKEGIPGKVFSYQLVATNIGTGPARRVLVSENLPPELEFVDAQPKPGQVEGQRLAWEIPDLGSGQREVLTVGVRVKKGMAAGTALRKSTMVRYRDMNDQAYESLPGK